VKERVKMGDSTDNSKISIYLMDIHRVYHTKIKTCSACWIGHLAFSKHPCPFAKEKNLSLAG
jgi:hypothetical protein